MRKFILLITFATIVIITTIIFVKINTEGQLFNSKDVVGISKEIIEREISLNKCSLNDEEKREALIVTMKKNNISMESFSEAKELSNIIVQGLEKVIFKKEIPEDVYISLNMQENNISKEVWQTYTTKYKTEESIARLKKYVPDSMEKIINTGYKQFGSQVEKWLLYEKIITSFDSKFPQMKSLSNYEKEQKWWQIAIKKYNLNPEQENEILQLISLSKTVSQKNSEALRKLFKAKLDIQ